MKDDVKIFTVLTLKYALKKTIKKTPIIINYQSIIILNYS